MKKIIKTVLAFSLVLLATGALSAQNKTTRTTLPVFNSPKGPVIIFGRNSVNAAGTDIAGNHYEISRMEQNSNMQKQLSLTGMAKNLSSFKKLTGDALVRQLQHQLKLNSEEALWQFIQQHADLSAYGLVALSVPFRMAMGAAYTDEDVKDNKGKTYVYTISETSANHTKNSFQSPVTIGRIPDFDAPHLIAAKASDSTVNISWKGKTKQDYPYMAFVYRQTGGSGNFQKLGRRILASRKGDSLSFLFTEKVNGNSAYRYFIRPADLLENEGAMNSDTASVLSVDYRKLPVVTQLKAKDTLNAIFLSWKALAANPMLTGIEIQRSRDSRGDYVVIDTLPPATASYTDTKLLPHVAYYYRLSVLHAGAPTKRKFYTPVSAASQKTNHIPSAPYGMTVTAAKSGISMHWKPVIDPDIYAYYVYRATSINAAMQVISPALRDTLFTDTATNLSRQLNYVYAVTAVTNASKESSFSEKIPARFSLGKEKPQTPGGIRVIEEKGRLKLQWEDVKKNDPSVLGYILYRHKMENKPLQYSASEPASAEATRLKLVPVFAGIILVPFYEDSISHTGDRYEYLVSAIDRFGVESGLSATAVSAKKEMARANPPAQLYVRSVAEGVALQWEQGELTGVQSFAVYRRTLNEKSMKKIAVVKIPVNQYTDKQAIPGTLNIYAVSAISAAGESGPSLEKSIRR